MSDESQELVEQKAQTFAATWNQALRQFPAYVLDGEFPSIGVIDRLLAPLRGQQKFNEQEEALLEGVACYCGVFVKNAWSCFPGNVEVRLFQEESSKRDVIVELKGGEILSDDQSQTIGVLSTLKRILSEMPNPLPVYRASSMPHAPFANMLSGLFAGICAGASPFSNGPLLDLSDERQKEHEAAICEFLAQSLSRSFSRLYPLEELFGDPAFFYSYLTLPPDYAGDGPPLLLQTTGIFQKLEGLLDEDERRERLLLALVRSTDDLCSKVGYALLAGFQKRVESPAVLEISASLGPRAFHAREAAIHCRHLQGHEGDWLKILGLERIEAAKHWFDLDYQLGFMPLFVFPVLDVLEEMSDAPFFHILNGADFEGGKLSLDVESVFPMQFPVVKLLLAKLLFQRGEFERVDSLLAELEYALPPDRVEFHFSRLATAGALAFVRGKMQRALDHWLPILEQGSQDLQRSDEICSLAIQALLRLGKPEDAVAIAERLIENSLVSFRTRVAVSEAYRIENDLGSLESNLQYLYKNAPNHPSVLLILRTYLSGS